jgi:hypothetical protein
VEPITLLIGSIHQPVVRIKRALRDALSKADYEYISGLEEFTRFVRLTGDRFWSEKDRCEPRREDTYCPLLLFAPDHPEYRAELARLERRNKEMQAFIQAHLGEI